MAVTKIHPIKTTLKKAIDYICNGDKTNDEIYVTTHLCSRENAHKEFELTKKQFNSRTKTLAHHLIQSFVPEEVSFEEAHQVGIELCEKILGGKYEYVLATHIDKNHIHNHIIFNSIDVDEGKIYHSYYGSYMNIRNQSDRLCKEHDLSVIDQETQKEINEIRRRKEGQQRFTRAKTIGENYTEERIKVRILNKEKELGNIIDIKNNEKVKSSKGYEHWATKHNLKIAASTLIEIRDRGFNSMEELERGISRISTEKNKLKREFDKLSWEQKRIKEVVKHIQICISKREHYEGYRKNSNDKIYMMMNRKDVEAYQKSYEEIDVFLKQFPHLKNTVLEGLRGKSGKNLFRKLNEHSKDLGLKQERIAKQHDSLMEEFTELKHLKNNMDDYLGREQRTEKNPSKSILKQIKEIGKEDRERKLPKNRGIER